MIFVCVQVEIIQTVKVCSAIAILSLILQYNLLDHTGNFIFDGHYKARNLWFLFSLALELSL